jgi:nitroreductase
MSVKHSEEILVEGFPHIRYHHPSLKPDDSLKASREFYLKMNTRRSLRHFSDKAVDKSVIENILKTAGTAPSGAHKQPWTFCAISSMDLKKKIREAAEKEEYESYHSRMPESWLKDLAPLGTDWQKPFLETVPWIIVVFKRVYEMDETGSKRNNYYVNESVGLACGILLAAIHTAGLATLTHTPSPMNFLSDILGRPQNERPFLLLPVGYPAQEAYVPKLSRKPLQDTSIFFE